MMNESNDQLYMSDLYSAGFLVMKGFEGRMEQNGDRFYVVFERTPELMEALRLYNAGELVSSITFVQHVKDLRTEMNIRKGSKIPNRRS